MNTSSPSPSREKGYKALHKSQHISAPRDSFVVQTEDLARILDERVDQLNRTSFREDTLSPHSEAGVGAVAAIVHHAIACSQVRDPETGEVTPKYTFEQLTRRLWSIRARECRAVRVEIADALLMGCSVNIEDTELATLPAGAIAAREAIDVHQEFTSDPLDELEAKRLERSLLHFAQGFVHDFHVVEQAVARGLEALFSSREETAADERQLALA